MSPFVNSFFPIFVKHKRDLRLKYVLATFAFFSSNFYLSTNGNIVYSNVKLCNRLQFDSRDYKSTSNELHQTILLSQCSILTIPKFKAISNNKSFYLLILIVSGDISLNPKRVYNHYPPNLKVWDICKITGLDLLHLNSNRFLPKTDELRFIAKLSNVASMWTTESKLVNCVLHSEIQINKLTYFVVTGTEKVEGSPAMSEINWAISKSTSFLKKWKTNSLRSYSRKLSL